MTPESLGDAEGQLKHLKGSNDVPSGQAQKSITVIDETTLNQTPLLHWSQTMGDTAHSNFFGLDLGMGYGPAFEVTGDVLDPASVQDNLQRWADVASNSASSSPLNSADKSAVVVRDEFASLIAEESGLSASVRDAVLITGKRSADSPPKASSGPSSPVKGGKVQKTFHFVENSNKREAARLRNTMTSRNLRQSKISRIAELERLLEESQTEAEMWKKRALTAGWKSDV